MYALDGGEWPLYADAVTRIDAADDTDAVPVGDSHAVVDANAVTGTVADVVVDAAADAHTLT